MNPSRSTLLLLAVALVPCCGSSCGGPETPPQPPSDSLPVPYLVTSEGTVPVRVRLSRPELVVDCSSLVWTVPVTDALFLAASSIHVTPQPRPLFRVSDRPSPESRCALIALEADGAEAVVVRTNPGNQRYIVAKEPKGPLQVVGATVLKAAKDPSASCEQRELPTWSETTLTGVVTVDAIENSNDPACSTLRLRPGGASTGPSLAWSLCLGDVRQPFHAGDVVKIESNVNPTSHTRLLHIERQPAGGQGPGERVALWLMRGTPGGLPATGWDASLFTLSNIQREDTCGAAIRTRCGTIEVGTQVSLQIDQRAMVLESGESVIVAHPRGPKLEVHVTRALMRPVVGPACKGEATDPVEIGVVVIERGGKKAAAQVAGPAPR